MPIFQIAELLTHLGAFFLLLLYPAPPSAAHGGTKVLWMGQGQVVQRLGSVEMFPGFHAQRVTSKRCDISIVKNDSVVRLVLK